MFNAIIYSSYKKKQIQQYIVPYTNLIIIDVH